MFMELKKKPTKPNKQLVKSYNFSVYIIWHHLNHRHMRLMLES